MKAGSDILSFAFFAFLANETPYLCSVGTNFLRLLSVTIHSTSSNRQFVQGEPFSTTSQRTLRARQQQQALDARLFTGRDVPDNPAAAAFRLVWG